MLTDIRLQNFRLYGDESFEFDPGVNIIVGANASGKTSLLEAVLMVCRGSSYRVGDSDLVRFEAPWLRVDAHTSNGMRTVKVERINDSVNKSFVVDNQSYKRLPFTKTVPVVLFEPNHLMLLSGQPDLRREYMDSLLEQLRPGYGTLRRQYRRTLAQRNALLKHGHSAQARLFAWNIRLSELGGQVAEQRVWLVERFDERIAELYIDLCGSSIARASLSYKSGCVIDQYGSDMLHKLQQTEGVDIERGFTSYGPHRDDMVVQLNDLPLQVAASRGETRTLLLVLKIVELSLIEEARGTRPVLLLDDVFSELDGSRRRALTEVLSDHQSFITTTDADVILKHFTQESHVIPINRTEIRQTR